MDCGQSDPISQLVQHVTEDQRFQASIGDPCASIAGSNQYNLMLPQSFRMHDLMREIGHIESKSMLMPSPFSSHFGVQSHSSPGTMWATEYQNQMQEMFQLKIEQMWDVPSMQNYGNETNYFPVQGFINVLPPYGLYESQNFLENQYQLNEFELKSQESRKCWADFESTVTIQNGDVLENLKQPEENGSYPKETQEQNCKDGITEIKTIPEFSNTREFKQIVETYIEDCRNRDLRLKHPNQKYYNNNDITSESILNPMVYSHIENNPMREELELSERGYEALDNCWFFQAELYFDAAVRKTETDPQNWLTLGYALYMNDKCDKAMSAIKNYSRFELNCLNSARLKFLIYNKYNCKYQACQSVFHWLKNTTSYKHLIPPDFSMDDKDTTELDDEILTSVKNIFLKAARERPTNIDADLQIMIGNLYSISKDYDKVIDCKLAAAISCSKESSVHEMRNLGYMLYEDDKPNEALDYFFKAAEEPNGGVNAYEDIGLVYMYLQNYREAIRYFKALLGPEGLGDETKFQLQGNTLADEYDLCLRLYYKIRSR